MEQILVFCALLYAVLFPFAVLPVFAFIFLFS